MGMYDTIICKCWLPMPDEPKGYTGSHDFQTKDLDLALSSYDIDENGQLFIHRYEGEWIEGNKNSESLFGRMGHFKTTKRWLEELNITTTIVFYDYQHSQNTGKMTSAKLINFEAKDNAERKKRDIEFDEKLKRHHEFINTWKYKYFVKPYNRSISYIFRKSSKAFYNLSYILNRIEIKIKL
jgi:hypothetical protein